jgi:hypothetical protein
MCRNIRVLRIDDVTATDDEVRAAAAQFVKKICGVRKPSTLVNGPYAEAIAEASERLLASLELPYAAQR